MERLKPAISSREYRWIFLPYGVCRLPDGSEALFNRRYQLIYTRSSERAVERLPVEPKRYESEAVKASTVWLYDDGTSEPERRKRCLAKLAEWGIDPRNPDVRLKSFA